MKVLEKLSRRLEIAPGNPILRIEIRAKDEKPFFALKVPVGPVFLSWFIKRIKASWAEKAWEITVAMAAPFSPALKIRIKIKSRIILVLLALRVVEC